MNITKIIIVFLLILAIIILLNKRKINEQLVPNTGSSEAINNYLTMIDKQIDTKLLSNQVCDEEKHCLSMKKLLLLASPINQYMYLPNECIIWNNLKTFKNTTPGFKAIGSTLNLISDTTLWNDKNVYQLTYNSQQPQNKYIEITVPPYSDISDISDSEYQQDFTVLWVQTNANIFMNFRLYNSSFTPFGTYTSGLSFSNLYSPDGSIHNERNDYFEWYPVPIKLNPDRKIFLNNPTFTDTWYSGFAFSTNPWNHCKISGLTVYHNLNKSGQDSSNIGAYPVQSTISVYNNMIPWNNQVLLKFTPGISTFRIPYVYSGRDKIFYIIESNESYLKSMINVKINNNIVGNLYTTFDNPFSRHNNSKVHRRYYGVVIPKNILTPNDNFITVTLTIPTMTPDFFFFEVGTHDVNPFD